MSGGNSEGGVLSAGTCITALHFPASCAELERASIVEASDSEEENLCSVARTLNRIQRKPPPLRFNLSPRILLISSLPPLVPIPVINSIAAHNSGAWALDPPHPVGADAVFPHKSCISQKKRKPNWHFGDFAGMGGGSTRHRLQIRTRTGISAFSIHADRGLRNI